MYMYKCNVLAELPLSNFGDLLSFLVESILDKIETHFLNMVQFVA